MKNKIINLHLHSQYSVLDGLGTPEDIIKKTKELNLPSVAITDHGNMNNFGRFYLSAKEEGIKPIFGCEFYHIIDIKKWNKFKDSEVENKKEKNKKLKRRYHLLLLVKNLEGFYNINMLIYHSYKNFYFKPRIDFQLIEKYSKGLICSSACLGGIISSMIIDEQYEKAEKYIKFFKSIFNDDFYIEIQFNELNLQVEVNHKLIELARKYKVKIIITQDSHYLNPNHYNVQQSLLLLQTKKTYKDLEDERQNIFQFDTKELYYKDYFELYNSMKRFYNFLTKKQFDEYCMNTIEISNKIEEFQVDREIKIKDIYPKIKNKSKYIYDLCIKELSKRKLLNKKYKDRLNLEIDIIREKNFENYFLLVHDIVKNARKKMFIGAGRGSGCGSLINYLLDITRVNPIKHNLIFQRFLNKHRSDPPDIDIDFEDNDCVKRSLMSKYPNEVGCITAYNTFKFSGLIRDLGRVYNIKDAQYFNKLNKTIKTEIKENLDDDSEEINFDILYNNSKTFKNFINNNKEIVLDLKTLLGQVRHVGKHAGGIVIYDNLIKLQPTMIINDIIQTSMSEGVNEKTLPDFGYVKIDILGLKTLKIIHDTMKYISKDKNIKISKIYNKIRADKINLEDSKVYKKIFIEKNLCGIFQFETQTAKPLIIKTKPECFEDLIAMNALNRPGPLQGGYSFEYGKRKREGVDDSVFFNNKIIKDILSNTHGILVYQEQVMELGNKLGDLTLEETNEMRKILVKAHKVKGELKDHKDKMKKKFLLGARKKIKEKDAILIWNMMENFSQYGFNRGHSVGYALISYQCAWLKTYFPIQFYTALLNNESEDNYSKIINEIRLNKLKIFGANIYYSNVNFSYNNDSIYWGFSNILGIGIKASEEIIKCRKIKKIKGLKDFIIRDDVDFRICNKRVIETFINLGIFDNIKNKRKIALKIFNDYNDYKNKKSYGKESWKSIKKEEKFSTVIKKVKKEFKESFDYTDIEKSEMEIKYYKCNIDFSPFNIKGRLSKIKKIIDSGKASGFNGECFYIIGQFINVRKFFDKRNNKMAFLDIIDIDGEIMNSIIFSSYYDDNNVIENNVYLISGEKKDKFFVNEYINIDNIFNK